MWDILIVAFQAWVVWFCLKMLLVNKKKARLKLSEDYRINRQLNDQLPIEFKYSLLTLKGTGFIYRDGHIEGVIIHSVDPLLQRIKQLMQANEK